jgi:flagellar biosynthetic protein FliR
MEIFQSETVRIVALLSTRLSGLMMVAPVFSARIVPFRARTAILVVLVIALFPAARGSTVAGAQLNASTFLTEALVGLTLGLGAALFVGAAESAGDMLAVQMGLSGANVLDPLAGTQMPVLGQFLGLFVIALLLAVGGHIVILEALAASLRVLPPGQVLDFQGGPGALAQIGGAQFVLGLRFAAPVVAAMMIGNAALGAMAKTVPQMNILMMAFPLQIGIGLITLGLTLPLIATFFGSWPDTFTDLVGGILDNYSVPEGSP